MSNTTPRTLGLTLLAALALAACGGETSPNDPPTDEAKIIAFAATPTTVPQGGTTTLTWTVSGSPGLSLRITATPGGELATETSLTGSLTSSPLTADTTFTLTVTKGTATATQQVSVKVDPTAVGITRFTASPQTPARGGQVTLDWATTNATSVAIYEGATQLFQSTTQVASGTTELPVPNAVHTFRLVAMKSATLMAERTLTVNTAEPAGEHEPNNDVSTAQVLTNAAASGSINPSGDVDYYRVTVQGGGSLRAQTHTGTSTVTCDPDTRLVLYAPDGVKVLATNDDGGPGRCASLDPRFDPALRNLTAGDYYLMLSAYGAASGDYVLQVEVVAPGCGNGLLETAEQCDDGNTIAGDGCDAACRYSVAGSLVGALPQAATLTGALSAGSAQYYEVVLPTEGYLWAAFGAPTLGRCEPEFVDPVLTLYNSAGEEVAYNDDYYGGWLCPTLDPTIDPSLRLPAGTYFLRVTELEGAAIPSYQLNLKTIVPDVCGNQVAEGEELCDTAERGCNATCGVEAAGSLAAPGGTVVVDVNPWIPGSVPLIRVIDLTLTEGQSVTAATSDGAAGCPFGTRMFLINADYTELLGIVDGSGACARFEVEDAVGLPAGTYHLGVISTEAVGGPVTVNVSVLDPGCGNGVTDTLGLATAEQCDDGNTTPGDGCDATCHLEVVGTVTPPASDFDLNLDAEGGRSQFIEINIANAGQSIRVMTSNGTGAVCAVQPSLSLYGPDYLGSVYVYEGTTDCTRLDPGVDRFAAELAAGLYLLEVTPTLGQGALNVEVEIVDPGCGNGVVEGTLGEQCDDGDTTADERCSATCTVPAVALSAVIGGPTVTVRGSATAEEFDTFAFTIPTGMNATLEAMVYTTSGHPALGCFGKEDTYLAVLRSDFSVLVVNDDVAYPLNACSSVTGDAAVAGLPSGTYYLQVAPIYEDAVDYFLDVRLVEAP